MFLISDEKSYYEAAEIILAVFFIVLTLATIVGKNAHFSDYCR